MADKHSFDIVSEVSLQELDNAINQAMRDARTRYDLKDTKSTIDFDDKKNELVLESESDFKLEAVKDILHTHLLKRGISIKALTYQDYHIVSGQRVKQTADLQQGIPQEKSKKIVKAIKALNLKVQSQIMGETVRVTGKKIDDLQACIRHLKDIELDCALSFKNLK